MPNSHSSLGITSGAVLDIGRGKVTCAAVCRGKQHPNSLSCDVPSAIPSFLASMIDRVVLESDENAEVNDTLKKHAVICSEFFIII